MSSRIEQIIGEIEEYVDSSRYLLPRLSLIKKRSRSS